MKVELYENPLEYGPRPLANKIVDARTFLDETEEIFMNVSHWFQKYTAVHRSATVALELGINGLMANDPETRAGRNLEIQKAIASVKLAVEVAEVAKLAAILDDLKAIIAVIRAKRADLKDTQTRIRDLQKLCSELIGLGSRWGSKPLPKSEAPDLANSPKVDRTTLMDLQRIFKGEKLPEDKLSEMLPPVVSEDPEPEPEAAAPEPKPTPDPPKPKPPVENKGQEPEVGIEPGSHQMLDAILGVAETPETNLTQYPLVGFCGEAECGQPVYQTPSGTACAGGHGGAEVLEDDPNDAPMTAPKEGEDPLLGGNGASDAQSDDFLSALDADAPKAKEKVDLDAILGEFGL